MQTYVCMYVYTLDTHKLSSNILKHFFEYMYTLHRVGKNNDVILLRYFFVFIHSFSYLIILIIIIFSYCKKKKKKSK